MKIDNKFIKRNLPQFNVLAEFGSREQWLKTRQSGIGGSDIGTLMGHNPYNTPQNVYWSKIDEVPRELPDTPAMEAGRYIEPILRKYYEDHTPSAKVYETDSVFIHKHLPYMLASVDGIIEKTLPDGSKSYGILECKNVGIDSKSWETGRPPLMYEDQLRHYMNVMDLNWGAIICLLGGQYFQITEYARDPFYEAKMEQTAKAFWETNVMPKVCPPPASPKEVLITSEEAKSIEATPDLIKVVKKYRDLKPKISDSNKQLDLLEAEIKIFMGSAETMLDPKTKTPLVSWVGFGTPFKYLNESKLRYEEPEIHNRYLVDKPQNRKFVVYPKLK